MAHLFRAIAGLFLGFVRFWVKMFTGLGLCFLALHQFTHEFEPDKQSVDSQERSFQTAGFSPVKKAIRPTRGKKSRSFRKKSVKVLDRGVASFYGKRWTGRKTASGEIFDHKKYTAAHKTLPFGAFVRVKRVDNGKSVVVRINDRGPFVPGRVIDLSTAAARHLGMVNEGLAKVIVLPATKKEFRRLFLFEPF